MLYEMIQFNNIKYKYSYLGKFYYRMNFITLNLLTIANVLYVNFW